MRSGLFVSATSACPRESWSDTEKNLHGTATKLKVMASVPFHRSLPGCSAMRPLRDGAHIGAL